YHKKLEGNALHDGFKLSHPGSGRTTSRARSTTWVTHHGSALAPFSLNFGVPTEPEASELPKGLVLGRDGNIHLRIAPLGDDVTSRPGADHFPGPLHHRSTILSTLGPNHALTWVTHPRSALAPFSLNFGVHTEPEANELPKGLMLGRDGNIHLRIAPLGDVGCYITDLSSLYSELSNIVSIENM
ncbi:hypothetical protein DVH24_030524, partial [Malus domestica]